MFATWEFDVDLSAVLQGVGAIWVAVVATLALNTWKRQLQASRQVGFIDDLAGAIHDFVTRMGVPIDRLRFAQLQIRCHEGAAIGFERYASAAAIAFIVKRGRKESASISEALAKAQPSLIRLQSLLLKGEVLGFKDYSSCQAACGRLVWTYGHIQAFASLIASDSLNWENPEVQAALSRLPKFDAERVSQTLSEASISLLEFARQAHQQIVK